MDMQKLLDDYFELKTIRTVAEHVDRAQKLLQVNELDFDYSQEMELLSKAMELFENKVKSILKAHDL